MFFLFWAFLRKAHVPTAHTVAHCWQNDSSIVNKITLNKSKNSNEWVVIESHAASIDCQIGTVQNGQVQMLYKINYVNINIHLIVELLTTNRHHTVWDSSYGPTSSHCDGAHVKKVCAEEQDEHDLCDTWPAHVRMRPGHDHMCINRSD